jgi:agmatine deiminase
VLEGGAIDWDGEGTVITTRECLLNPNRNPGMSEEEAERWLYEALGFTRVIWLDGGLANDHTDGHVDNIARFIAPGRVVCQEPFGSDDPNAKRLDEIYRALAASTDASGRKLDVLRLPSPGRVVDAEGQVMPASHMNFIIGNAHVVMPTYATPRAWEEAVIRLQKEFATRTVWPLPAKAILSGGGAFHCITQQQPADVSGAVAQEGLPA